MSDANGARSVPGPHGAWAISSWHNILCRGGLLLRGTDDEGVCVLVVPDHFVHE